MAYGWFLEPRRAAAPAVALKGVWRWVFWSCCRPCVHWSRGGHGHQLQIWWFGRGLFCVSVMRPKGLLKLLFFSEVINAPASLQASRTVVQDQHFLNLISLWHVFFHCQPGLNLVTVFISDFFEDNGGRCRWSIDQDFIIFSYTFLVAFFCCFRTNKWHRSHCIQLGIHFIL